MAPPPAVLPPAVVVHGFGQACAALAIGRPVTLLSAAGAGVYGGVGWWHGLVGAARAEHPGVPCLDILDCAGAPGAAMAALRRGQSLLVLDPACPAFAAVAAAARVTGAAVLPVAPPAIDLADARAPTWLDAWLAANDSAAATR